MELLIVRRVRRKGAGKASRGPATGTSSTTAPTAGGTAIKGRGVFGRETGIAERARGCWIDKLAKAQHVRQSGPDSFERFPYHQISCDAYGESSWWWDSQARRHRRTARPGEHGAHPCECQAHRQ